MQAGGGDAPAAPGSGGGARAVEQRRLDAVRAAAHQLGQQLAAQLRQASCLALTNTVENVQIQWRARTQRKCSRKPGILGDEFDGDSGSGEGEEEDDSEGGGGANGGLLDTDSDGGGSSGGSDDLLAGGSDEEGSDDEGGDSDDEELAIERHSKLLDRAARKAERDADAEARSMAAGLDTNIEEVGGALRLRRVEPGLPRCSSSSDTLLVLAGSACVCSLLLCALAALAAARLCAGSPPSLPAAARSPPAPPRSTSASRCRAARRWRPRRARRPISRWCAAASRRRSPCSTTLRRRAHRGAAALTTWTRCVCDIYLCVFRGRWGAALGCWWCCRRQPPLLDGALLAADVSCPSCSTSCHMPATLYDPY